MRGVLAVVVAMVAGVALSGCVQMEVGERNFIHPDAPGTVHATHFSAAGARELEVARPDGAVLRGVLAEAPGAQAVVLYFGGNAFHIDEDMAAMLSVLGGCGTNIATFDYRGYGRSTGAPDVRTMQQDALAVYDALERRFPGRVLVHGQSLGSFIAAYVSQQRPVRATVLESTATNAEDWANANVPWYMKPFVRVSVSAPLQGIDNAAAAAQFKAPALVIAGGHDKVTPPALGRRVFEAIPAADKRFLLLDSAGHNNALATPAAQAKYCDFVHHAAI